VKSETLSKGKVSTSTVEQIATKKTNKEAKKEISLLDLDFSEPSSGASLPVVINATASTSNLYADLANLSSSSNSISAMSHFNQTNFVSKKEHELINKVFGQGLQIQYRFTRQPHLASNKMVTIELICTNVSQGDFSSLSIANKKLPQGMSMSDLSDFDLVKGATCSQQVGIDFNDTMQSAQFEITGVYSNDPLLGGTSMAKKWPNLSIGCPIGELVSPGWSISENEFNKLQAKLKGMNEINGSIDGLTHALFMSKNLNAKLLESFNMCQIPSSQQDTLKFAAQTFSTKTPLLLSIYFASNSKKCQINVNCEKIVLANMFSKEIQQLLQ
jgi:hypothetical protein